MARIAKPKKVGYKKSEVSRAHVLDAAIAVLSKKGIAGTSVQDIANSAGLSKGSVHYHFENKEELLERVLDRSCEIVEERIRAAFQVEGTPIERVRRTFAEMWRLRRDGAREMRVLTELHLAARQNPRLRKVFADALERARRQIIDTGLGFFVAMGLTPRVSVDIIPRLIIAAMDGLALQHEIEPIPPDVESEMIRALEALTFALFEQTAAPTLA